MLDVRYGNRPLPIKAGKGTIQVGEVADLVPTLNLLRDAVIAGELDKVLIATKNERAANWSKRRK